MIYKIGKITLYVNNQEEAKKFWIRRMNFVVKHEEPMGTNATWLEIGPNECAYTTFVLYEKKLILAQNPNANVEHPSIILSCKNIEETYTEAKSYGVNLGELITMPHGKMFTFFDQDNNPYLVRED